jgi:3-hydroxyisobutyrate dehydrogenase-like beta-hydroxyacid dehydrogenase
MRVAVLGLGEAGALIAADLVAAGADVVGFDPVARPAGLPLAESAGAAVRRADVVLSLNSAAVAERVAIEAMPAAAAGAVWADLNTAAPDLKQRLDALSVRHGLLLADVAVMAPVPPTGLRTRCLASGPGAPRYAELMVQCGAMVDVLDGPAGAAAERKLLRSVFMKGMAAALLEALAAARAAGCEEWLRADVGRQIGPELVDRLDHGSHLHAARRAEEMTAAVSMLAHLGVPDRVATAARDWLADLTDLAGRTEAAGPARPGAPAPHVPSN